MARQNAALIWVRVSQITRDCQAEVKPAEHSICTAGVVSVSPLLGIGTACYCGCNEVYTFSRKLEERCGEASKTSLTDEQIEVLSTLVEDVPLTPEQIEVLENLGMTTYASDFATGLDELQIQEILGELDVPPEGLSEIDCKGLRTRAQKACNDCSVCHII
ncbi:hypothetical protein DM01DRAFT_1348361 [Hesseltinella vesiculosa]|uniref:Uncharacterized protein n=1 Tax=Hesseltinella vesiculosa TaxID=101127 RepID=A0A1X2G9V6_9FUNG|nr:hypothetical protein DM01DRAFT_1348361 [Hesseltinella vesiculosa]